ncbi:MAG: hypothetical protein C5B50_24805 [Verrucomicrobia bacterium]|nr:MAG: hypothetical protein C5B50_24805 [Verrucomicrobiota bacterium]
MTIHILPSATEDLAAGADFYLEKGEGLDAYFLESLFSDIDSLKLYAGIHRKVYGLHRCLSKRFPYFIYYAKTGTDVFVKAVLDCRRDPDWIKQRLRAIPGAE